MRTTSSTRRRHRSFTAALCAALIAALCGSVAAAPAVQAQADRLTTPLVANEVIFDPVASGYDDSLGELEVDANGTIAAAVVTSGERFQVVTVDLTSGASTTRGRLTAAEPNIILSEDGSTLAVQYLNGDENSPASTTIYDLSANRSKRIGYTGFLHDLSRDGQAGSGLDYNSSTESFGVVVVNTNTGATQAIPDPGNNNTGVLHNTAISGDGTVVAAYTHIGYLFSIDLNVAGAARWKNTGQTHRGVARLDGGRFWNTTVALSFDGSVVAYQGLRPTVKNLITNRRTVMPAPQERVLGYDVDISADGRLVAFSTRSAISEFDSGDENFDTFIDDRGTGDVYAWNPGNGDVTWGSLLSDLDSIGSGGRNGHLVGGGLDQLIYKGQASAVGGQSSTNNTILRSTPLERSQAQCGEMPATVILILGDKPTGGDDVILGTAANDTIRAGNGDDVICGGSGDDNIIGGNGDDVIFDGADDDTVNAGPGNDTIIGYGSLYERKICSKSETYLGGDGNDTIIGVSQEPHVGELADCPTIKPLRVDGGAGSDTLSVRGERFTILGGTGNDTLTGIDSIAGVINGGPGRDAINGATKANGGTGNDKITGTNGNDELVGGKGNDTIIGGKGDDVIQGGGGKDKLNGNGGADVIRGGTGRDTIDGGAGSDMCFDARRTSFTKCEVQKRR